MFKEQAVKMATETGPRKTARDLGIPVNTHYTLISKSKKHGECAHVSCGNKRQNTTNSEVAEPLKRNRELERANQIRNEALVVC
jgi:transposase-like protein